METIYESKAAKETELHVTLPFISGTSGLLAVMRNGLHITSIMSALDEAGDKFVVQDSLMFIITGI